MMATKLQPWPSLGVSTHPKSINGSKGISQTVDHLSAGGQTDPCSHKLPLPKCRLWNSTQALTKLREGFSLAICWDCRYRGFVTEVVVSRESTHAAAGDILKSLQEVPCGRVSFRAKQESPTPLSHNFTYIDNNTRDIRIEVQIQPWSLFSLCSSASWLSPMPLSSPKATLMRWPPERRSSSSSWRLGEGTAR